MRAVVAESTGDPDVLRLGAAPLPNLQPEDVLVRVRAAALNRADLLQRRGKYPPPEGASKLLGLEVSGEIVTCGSRVEGWREGDRVAALLAGGGYAEYAAVRATHLLRLPGDMSFEEAAAIPEAFLTAYQALALLGEARPGDHVLIHAGASGVGTAAIQLARKLGAYVHTTASASKLPALGRLGANTRIDYNKEDFAERVLEATEGHGADVVVDVIGAPYAAQHLRCLALDGHWVVLATMGGSLIEAFDLRRLFARRGRLITSTLRNRSESYKAHLVARFDADCWNAFAQGTLYPVIDKVYDWSDVVEAHERMEARLNVGKIVLRVTDG